jgi:hypothetical protein
LLGDCWVPTGLDAQVSPDEQWVAAPCDLGETSHLRIINKQELNVWEPARFRSIFLASGFSCSQALSTPAHQWVTHTVRR